MRNYRLSRAQRIVENAFGLMCSRFRCLLRTMELDVPNAMQVVRAWMALHNLLISQKDQFHTHPGCMDFEDELGNVVNGSWRTELGSENSIFARA